jgi:tRNA-specific 2-thiouridylase
VIGVFLRLWDPRAGKGSRCCSLEDLEDARRVASHLGIVLHDECISDLFYERVFLPSLQRYADGLTPNPCVVCNEQIKFAELEHVMDQLEADLLVTGHYARIVTGGDGRPRLLRGVDAGKDQSYFLHRLSSERLRRICFPLGERSKDEVRQAAAAAQLPVAGKPESQELCFVPEGTSYAELLEQWLPEQVRPGAIVDRTGNRLGSHEGVHRYTVGQRRGLGISAAEPLYVLELDAASGTVVVGPQQQLAVTEIAVAEVSWVAGEAPAASFSCSVQIRSRHCSVPATVEVGDSGSVSVHPEQPLSAPAPGQAAVLYDGDEVLGGGWIIGPA